MANPIAPSGGFKQGGWYEGKQYWNGTFSEPGQINPQSNQQGAGQMVSPEVNAASAGQQGVTPQQLESYLQKQRALTPTPTGPTPPTGTPSAGGVGVSMPVAPTINLPELYKSLTKDSGIEAIQGELSAKEKAYNEAVSKINDNPFLSEASRVGRVQKLTTDYQNSIKSLQTDVATKKADIETQLNLKSKQFDIESQQAKDALTQFNTLLEMGSLNNAGGDEIAAIIRTTGLSSNMIQSAINAQKTKGIKTTLERWDDGTNQGIAVIDSNGNIINKQVIAGSKPDKTKEGLTDTQKREVVSSARKAIIEVDTNSDKALSLQEFKDVIESIMTSTGIDQATAEEYAAQAFSDLGYKTWNWSKK